MDKLRQERARKRWRDSTIGILDVIEIAVTADATSGVSITAPYACKIIDAFANCTTANAGGTLTLSDGTNAISNAVTCAVLDVNTRASTIDSTYGSIQKGSTLKVTANGAADRGVMYVIVKRI